MLDLEAAYWERHDVLIESCRFLQDQVQTSLTDVSGSESDFRVIDVKDLVQLAQVENSSADVWRESSELIIGTVTALTEEDLSRAWELAKRLFTVHSESAAIAICLIPPWAKSAAWVDPLSLPSHFTIRFVTKAEEVTPSDILSLQAFHPLTLALSGGGLRATLFQLGVLVYLAEQNRLRDVKEIVSVSGGSILAGHFLKHWPQAISNADGFRVVAAALVKECRLNIRNRVFVPWLYSRLIPWCWFSKRWGRTQRLKSEYRRMFELTTLGDLSGDDRPKIAIVATDVVRRERVAFTAGNVLRWPIEVDGHDKHPMPSQILSKGVELSLAVAASSCFPPVFPRLHLTYKDLGITYREFKESLHLNDGGVMTNLGIEVLVALRAMGWTKKTLILIANAERPLVEKPGRSPMVNVDASLAALSEGARDLAKREFGESGVPIQFSDRVENGDGLSFRTQTALFGYRTDLDCPTWQEIHALLIQGAMVARQAAKTQLTSVGSEELKKTIASIIEEAGGQKDVSLPGEEHLSRCGKRPKGRIVLHGVVVALLMIAVAAGFALSLSAMFGWWPFADTSNSTVEWSQAISIKVDSERFSRDNIALQESVELVVQNAPKDSRFIWTSPHLGVLNQFDGPRVVFTATELGSEALAVWIEHRGVRVSKSIDLRVRPPFENP